jgi:hypothetical protein
MSKIGRTRAKDLLVGMFDKLSTSMINLLGTVAWLEILLTLEIGTTPKTKLALRRDGNSVQNTVDFMVCRKGGQPTRRETYLI